MNSLDLIGAVALAASAGAMITLPAAWYMRSAGGSRLLILHGLWFALIVAIVASGLLATYPRLATPLTGLIIVIPGLAIWIASTRAGALRTALDAIPLPVLIGVHVMRLEGLFFVLLYANGRLPAPFAPEAGWGDIVVGALALPVAWALMSRRAAARPLVLLWNALGVLDLVAAIGLGVTSAPQSPLQIFHGPVDTAIMGNLPWAMIPMFLVPTLFITHLVIFRRLGRSNALQLSAA